MRAAQPLANANLDTQIPIASSLDAGFWFTALRNLGSKDWVLADFLTLLGSALRRECQAPCAGDESLPVSENACD